MILIMFNIVFAGLISPAANPAHSPRILLGVYTVKVSPVKEKFFFASSVRNDIIVSTNASPVFYL